VVEVHTVVSIVLRRQRGRCCGMRACVCGGDSGGDLSRVNGDYR
jgi:hypothetical protein